MAKLCFSFSLTCYYAAMQILILNQNIDRVDKFITNTINAIMLLLLLFFLNAFIILTQFCYTRILSNIASYAIQAFFDHLKNEINKYFVGHEFQYTANNAKTIQTKNDCLNNQFPLICIQCIRGDFAHVET